MKTSAVFLLLAASRLALADVAILPDAEQVRKVLSERPEARAAQGEFGVAEAQRERRLAGEHEWSLRIGGQRRRSEPTGVPGASFAEWNAGIERALRLPNKARIDEELGDADVARARSMVADSQHEARRALLRDWFAWVLEKSVAAEWTQQVENSRRSAQAVERRLALGDASRLEATLAASTLARAEVEWQQALAAEREAQETLQSRYPGLNLALPLQLPAPTGLPGSDAEWTARIVSGSHELALAAHQARLAELAAARQRAERLPDPTVGLAYARERGGEEQVYGAFVSIPLPGEARRAGDRAARAAADAAQQTLRMNRREIELAAASQVRRARASLLAWQAAQSAAERQGAAAAMSARAYQLGEGDLNDLLLMQRQAGEARLLATRLQVDALMQSNRVMLDAESLWSDESAEAQGEMH